VYVLKTGGVAAVIDSVASGEPVSAGDEWNVEETSGNASTPAWRVTTLSCGCVWWFSGKFSCTCHLTTVAVLAHVLNPRWPFEWKTWKFEEFSSCQGGFWGKCLGSARKNMCLGKLLIGIFYLGLHQCLVDCCRSSFISGLKNSRFYTWRMPTAHLLGRIPSWLRVYSSLSFHMYLITLYLHAVFQIGRNISCQLSSWQYERQIIL